MPLSPDGLRKLDAVVRSEVLVDADALAAALGAPVERKAGRRAARVNAPSISFPAPRRDLRAFDRIVVVLHTEGRRIGPKLGIELATRTRGLDADDSFNSGHAEPTAFADWGEYLFPYENFLVFGMGRMVYPARTMSLAFGAAPVWIAEIRAEKRDRAEGPRLTDAGLLAALDLDAADPDGVLAHFRARTEPRDIYSELPDPPAGWTPAAADDICRHFINGYDVGDPINWRINPNGYLEWQHAFNRHGWFKELLRAIRATNDPKYVRALDEIWLSWLRANPEPIGHNGGGDPAWETLSTAVRIYGSWLNAWFGLLHNPDFRDGTRIEILKGFHGHAEHLLRYRGYANNWLVVESRVLFVLGALFPEFRRAKAWLEEGRRRLNHEIERQVFPDGADFEFSLGYHMMACRGFLEPFEVAKLNGIALPAVFEERLPKTFEYVAGLTRPDGSRPSVNDSGGYRGGWAASKDFLALGARLFDRPDLAASPEGPFAGRSRCFPDAGFHVLASGTGHEALWLLLDCGEPGASHQHYDALSLEVFAHGLPFVVDPGITGYFRDPWTAYYRTTEAHNSVLVNGAGQRRDGWIGEVQSVRDRVERAFGERADFVRARYERGYAGLPDGIVHTRAVLFLRGACWVVFDEVSGEGVEEIEARYQFAPMRLTVDRRARRFRTLRQSRPNLEIIVAHPRAGARLSVACGETNPVGGWVSDGEDVPAPQARIRLKCHGEDDRAQTRLRLVTVLYPFAEGINSGVRVREIAGLPEGVAGLEIARGRRGGERVFYSWGGAPIPFDGRTIEASVLIADGKGARAVRDGEWHAP